MRRYFSLVTAHKYQVTSVFYEVLKPRVCIYLSLSLSAASGTQAEYTTERLQSVHETWENENSMQTSFRNVTGVCCVCPAYRKSNERGTINRCVSLPSTFSFTLGKSLSIVFFFLYLLTRSACSSSIINLVSDTMDGGTK